MFFSRLQTKDFRFLDRETCEIEFNRARANERSGFTPAAAILDELTEVEAPIPARPRAASPADPVDPFDPVGPSAPKASFSLIDWTPQGAPVRANLPECSADRLGEEMLRARPGQQPEAVKAFFKRCERHLSRFTTSHWWGLLKIGNTNYRLCQHPRIRKYVLRVGDGNIVRGYIAIKPGAEKRPLVIMKCGVYCNAGDPSQRFMIMHLFDEGPFNVMTVASNTGYEYVGDNEHLALGGLDEGTQLMRIAQWVRSSPLGKSVSRLHLAGVSLGGQAALFASAMNEYNPGPDGARPLSSVLAACPVVDLQASVKELFQPNLKGKIARWMFLEQLLMVISKVPILRILFPDIDKTEVTRIPEVIAEGAVKYYQTVPEHWALPPFQGVRIADREELWKLNRFQDYAIRPIRTPTFVFAADEDWIVPTHANTSELMRRLRANSQVRALTVPLGNHCAFQMMYGWDVISSLYRNYFLAHSPEVLARARTLYAPINAEHFGYRMKIWKYEHHFSQEFEFRTGRDYLTVRFKIWSMYENDACWDGEPYGGADACFRTEWVRLPFSELGAPWARVPRNDSEAESLTRWANANLRVEDAGGQLLHQKQSRPARLRWVSYEP